MIWIIGGTSDAQKIADYLTANHKKVLVSTTTPYGAQLAKSGKVTVIQKALNLNDMVQLINDYSINTIIDASHPFAQDVSKNGMEAALATGVKYIRFERENIHFNSAKYFESYNDIIEYLKNSDGNILLTIGSKNIDLFAQVGINRITARVLPVADSIILCNKAGLKAHQIIACKGILNTQTNKALLTEYNIKYMVTKDSGAEGGMIEKINAANQLNVEVLILKRPQLNYPVVFNDMGQIEI